jgi:elongation factor Ts
LIIEFNAETDFVVRSDRFQAFVESVFALAKEKKPNTVEEVMAMPFESSNVKDALDNLSGVIGEKLDVKQCAYVTTSGTVAAYSHMGGHIGVLVELDQAGKLDLAKDVAMHVAAANPRYNTPEEVPAEEVAKEKDIYREQLLKEGKPEAMIEKIMDGKVNKYYEEVCLIKQEYIKDDKKKVGEILEGAKIVRFFRFSLQSQASC